MIKSTCCNHKLEIIITNVAINQLFVTYLFCILKFRFIACNIYYILNYEGLFYAKTVISCQIITKINYYYLNSFLHLSLKLGQLI